MLMESEHLVPCGRNAGLSVGVEFVELHWMDWSAARGGIADNGIPRFIVTAVRQRGREVTAYLVVSLTNAAMIC
jgi:hypothetical protein